MEKVLSSRLVSAQASAANVLIEVPRFLLLLTILEQSMAERWKYFIPSVHLTRIFHFIPGFEQLSSTVHL